MCDGFITGTTIDLLDIAIDGALHRAITSPGHELINK